jgi:hypothetical protein
MLKKQLKQFSILRQKYRLENLDPIFFKKGFGIFSSRHVTNSFLNISNKNLRVSGCSISSTNMSDLDKSYAVFISGFVFWGPWLPTIRALHYSPASLRGVFPQGRIISVLKNAQKRLLQDLSIPYIFLSTINAILLSRIY